MKSSVVIVKNDEIPVTWTVEANDIDNDGSVDVTIFSGPDAQARAHEYAVWKYQGATVEREYA